MPPKDSTTPSTRPVRPRLSATERRAAEIAASANKQAQLKREAAERRAARARRDAESPPSPGTNAVTHHARSR
jgi:hypothetical protein